MTPKYSLFVSTLKSHGFSVTAARRYVYDALARGNSLTIRQLTDAAPINRASIYRCIHLFERLGIVRRVYTGWKYKIELSDAFDHHHHHATCEICGAVISLAEDDALEAALANLARDYDFRIITHQVELVGRCSNCH